MWIGNLALKIWVEDLWLGIKDWGLRIGGEGCGLGIGDLVLGDGELNTMKPFIRLL